MELPIASASIISSSSQQYMLSKRLVTVLKSAPVAHTFIRPPSIAHLRHFQKSSINMGKEDLVTAFPVSIFLRHIPMTSFLISAILNMVSQGILDIAHQEQNLPGLDKKMKPLAKHTLIECWDNNGKPYLKEYQGSGKLEGKTALITGRPAPAPFAWFFICADVLALTGGDSGIGELLLEHEQRGRHTPQKTDI